LRGNPRRAFVDDITIEVPPPWPQARLPSKTSNW
jgi:hypothetical protein